MLDSTGRRDTVQTVITPGQIACLLAYAGFLALWSYAELIALHRYTCTNDCFHGIHVPPCTSTAKHYVCLCRHGKGTVDEEHASPKESVQSMQPLAVGQRSPQPHLGTAKDQQVDVGVARSGFVR